MRLEGAAPRIEKLQILSVNRLADILKIPKETLVRLSTQPESNYAPFEMLGRSRPFQKEPPTKLRPIDNPRAIRQAPRGPQPMKTGLDGLLARISTRRGFLTAVV